MTTTVETNIFSFPKIALKASDLPNNDLKKVDFKVVGKAFNIDLLNSQGKSIAIYKIEPQRAQWGKNSFSVEKWGTKMSIQVKDNDSRIKLAHAWQFKKGCDVGVFLSAVSTVIGICGGLISPYASREWKVVSLLGAVGTCFFYIMRNRARFDVMNKLISMAALAETCEKGHNTTADFDNNTPLITQKI